MEYDGWYYIKDWVLNVILDKGATDTNVIGYTSTKGFVPKILSKPIQS